MEYKIISADSKMGQIQVSYIKDGKNLGVYAIDVPIENGMYITGDALEKEILHRAPLWVSDRLQATNTATGFDQIEALVQGDVSHNVPTEEQLTNQKMWEDTYFEQQVAQVLVKFGVLSKDPTIIPVVKL
jgi:hypothetical protein